MLSVRGLEVTKLGPSLQGDQAVCMASGQKRPFTLGEGQRRKLEDFTKKNLSGFLVDNKNFSAKRRLRPEDHFIRGSHVHRLGGSKKLSMVCKRAECVAGEEAMSGWKEVPGRKQKERALLDQRAACAALQWSCRGRTGAVAATRNQRLLRWDRLGKSGQNQ